MQSSAILLVSMTILLFLTTSNHAVQGDSGLSQMLKSIDQTCNNIHGLLTYERKIVNIQVTKEAPLRVKVDMELTSQYSPTLKHRFSVEGMVCHHGFDRKAGEAACRSKKKKLQMMSDNYYWEPSYELNDKCYFEFNSDPFIVPCHFILDNFNCTSDATSLNDCTHSALFQHQCTNNMHVGIGCSGTYEQATTVTTTTATTTTTTTASSIRTSTTTRSTDEEVVIDVLNRHNWTDIGAVIDVTGSMTACYTHIDEWIALSHSNKLVQYFAFFNDGDGTPDTDKIIGSTGGIYGVYTREGIAKVKETLTRAKINGGGGDTPENDIEAIIYTISNCSTCENIIHIADNGATPRDLVLLNQVKKPIKVLVCKLPLGSLVNPKLLDIAYRTGGSLHTFDMDIETLSSLKVNDTIQVGSGTYKLTANGFIRIV